MWKQTVSEILSRKLNLKAPNKKKWRVFQPFPLQKKRLFHKQRLLFQNTPSLVFHTIYTATIVLLCFGLWQLTNSRISSSDAVKNTIQLLIIINDFKEGNLWKWHGLMRKRILKCVIQGTCAFFASLWNDVPFSKVAWSTQTQLKHLIDQKSSLKTCWISYRVLRLEWADHCISKTSPFGTWEKQITAYKQRVWCKPTY